jgi:hypothetical protein
MLLTELRARAWQAGTFGAAGVALAVALGVAHFQKAAVTKERDALHAAINEPVTGYIATGARCVANARQLTGALAEQSAAVDAIEAESDRRIAAAEAGWRDAQRTAADARSRAARLSAASIAGATPCERVEDADRTVMEILRR